MVYSDIVEAAKRADDKIPRQYDMCVSDIILLHKLRISDDSDGEINAYRTAFNAGFVMGARAAKNGRIGKI